MTNSRSAPSIRSLVPLFTVSILLVQGCAPRFSNHTIGNGNVTTVSYQSDWRAATIVYRPSTDEKIMAAIQTRIATIAQIDTEITKSHPREQMDKIARRQRLLDEISEITKATSTPYVLAEPPPQMANEFTFNLKGSVDKVQLGQLDFGSTAAKMFEVSGYNLAIRDALYRLNEATFQGAIDKNKYDVMFNAVLQAAATMSKHESDSSIAKWKALQEVDKKKQEAVTATGKIKEEKAKVDLAQAKVDAAKPDSSEGNKVKVEAEKALAEANADLNVAKADQKLLVTQANNLVAKALAEFPDLGGKVAEDLQKVPIPLPAQ